MRRRRHILFFPFLVSLAAGCSGQPEGAEYFSVLPGSRHTYDVTMIIPLVGVVEGTMIVREDGTTDIAGRTYHRSVITYNGIPGAESAVSYVRLAPDGIYSRKSTEPNARDRLDMPLPLAVGRKWSHTEDNLTMEMEIAAVEDFDTAEKTYKRCVKITGSGTKGRDRIKTVLYCAPRIGAVKICTERSGVLMEMTLRGE